IILKQYRRGFHRDAEGGTHRMLPVHVDFLWMTKAEWQALVPEQPRVGDSITVPEFLVSRIAGHHAQMVSPASNLRISAAPKPTLTLTVEDASPDQLRLGLQGSFQVTEYEIPEPTNGIIDYQAFGCLHYDVKKKIFSRFDVAALGDVRNVRKDITPVP